MGQYSDTFSQPSPSPSPTPGTGGTPPVIGGTPSTAATPTQASISTDWYAEILALALGKTTWDKLPANIRPKIKATLGLDPKTNYTSEQVKGAAGTFAQANKSAFQTWAQGGGDTNYAAPEIISPSVEVAAKMGKKIPWDQITTVGLQAEPTPSTPAGGAPVAEPTPTTKPQPTPGTAPSPTSPQGQDQARLQAAQQIYLRTWGEYPPQAWLKRVEGSDQNLFEIEQAEREKPAFKQTPVYRDARAQALAAGKQILGLV